MASSRSTGVTFGVTGKKTGQLKPGKSSSETLLATKPQKLSRPSDKLNPKTVDPVSIDVMFTCHLLINGMFCCSDILSTISYFIPKSSYSAIS